PLSRLQSRKVHGIAGAFDLELPISGGPGIECRSGGDNGEYSMVFEFANSLTSVATAKVTGGTGSVASSMIDSDNRTNYIVNLTHVTNAQSITVTLTNVYDSAGNAARNISASMGILVGDVTGNHAVSNTDVGEVKAQVN